MYCINRFLSLFLLMFFVLSATGAERKKYGFNTGWLLSVGDIPGAQNTDFRDKTWEKVTVPHAFNEHEAFARAIAEHSDTVMWYRKHFKIIERVIRDKYFIEFEGVRFAADVYINGHHVGSSENGIMAFGFDITNYLKQGDNVIAVRVDNDWRYKEKTTGSTYQWNDRNFNANYGGIVKNVWLHRTPLVHQTLPLYSNLLTTGTYIYGTDYNIAGHEVTVNVESQVQNESSEIATVVLLTRVVDLQGNQMAKFRSAPVILQPGEMEVIKSHAPMKNVNFWSWGYGYLYNVETSLETLGGEALERRNNNHVQSGRIEYQNDLVVTRTGFRKLDFTGGRIRLNDRVMMVHGYAQRSSNEWPAVGIDIPAWLSDYSNALQVESGGNMVRWMHICPSKQDIESCDRVGLPMSMQAGDAEKDVTGRRWGQRTEVMRDAIIYNRNNPSIFFYECGNKGISREHMTEMLAIRNQYDSLGGRAMGSREMLDVDEAEYGGEMLYINKSGSRPMWSMEYCRDEGLRKYWDNWSFPYHKDGDGPLYRGGLAPAYNHNMDSFVEELVRRWNEYLECRPGMGRRVSSGGVKIVFSDTNTHQRGEVNYRTSGVVDAMRIPKDAFYAHQVMWNGWVEPEKEATYIVGHWNYKVNSQGDGPVIKPVYVVSTADSVVLRVNDTPYTNYTRQDRFLFKFDNVRFEEGKIQAVGYSSKGLQLSVSEKFTAGKPHHLKLTTIENPAGFRADGADLALVQIELVDEQGRRCPLDNRMLHFNFSGEGRFLGGIAVKDSPYSLNADGKPKAAVHDEAHAEKSSDGMLDRAHNTSTDNFVLSQDLPLECGVNRVLLRSTTNAGTMILDVFADGVRPERLVLHTRPYNAEGGLMYPHLMTTPAPSLVRGATPSTPSYKELYLTHDIKSATAGSNADEAKRSYDDNEASEWVSDGNINNAWITYQFAKKVKISKVDLKLTGWRNKVYPLEIYEGDHLVWRGVTEASLGYVHIDIPMPVKARDLTICMTGPAVDSDKFADAKELAGGVANAMDRVSNEDRTVKLRIVEIDCMEKIAK